MAEFWKHCTLPVLPVTRRSVMRQVLACAVAAAFPDAPAGWLAAQGASGVHFSVAEFDRQRILHLSDAALSEPAVILAGAESGSPHLFQSYMLDSTGHDEDAADPAVSLDASRLRRMCARTASLTAAWKLTKETRYWVAALSQLRAWCIAAETRMEPTLQRSGLLPDGSEDDRFSGVQLTVALAEAARAAAFVLADPTVDAAEAAGIRRWFADLLHWLNESKKGTVARDSMGLDAICWTMQAAEFARFTGNDVIFRECIHRFRDKLLRQMNFDGYFPRALSMRRPYAASMFALECMGAACESLSTPFESQWKFNLPDGRGMRSAVAWALPFLVSRGKWPYPADRQHFGAQPLRENALLFAARALDETSYVDAWKMLPADSSIPVLAAEHPVSQPALWAQRPPAAAPTS